MDKRLLSILCCPVTHRDLLPAKPDVLRKLNAAIADRRVRNRDGAVLEAGLDEALVTDDGKLLYPVAEGIPVLLEGESIGLEQLDAA
ncbi:MAG: Trm112 family protein [Gammaproteobacteria bacterium]|nr:Trm112 family protein [Gammaproteobacteria bacterium]MDH4253856.1 Trm112 family protein [Gammaproteobacteria bacterium]MDH5310449.1 Trm112 family protein [Gammaproteobacteria bacterium]